MQLINNRYRVVRDIEKSEIWSSYVVRDLLGKNSEKVLTVVDGEGIGTELLNFFVSEFVLWKNVDSPFILKNFEPELVRTVGGKRCTELKYCVPSEFPLNAVTLYEHAIPLPEENILDVFSYACRAVYYLHVKNIPYRDINFTNVFVVNDDNGYSLKLRDYAGAWLCRGSKIDEEINGAYFKAPETFYGDESGFSTDIYLLGVLLFCLLTGAAGKSRNFRTDFNEYKESYNKSHNNGYIPIIEKATAEISTRYTSVIELLDDINTSFGTEYTAFNISELERLYFGACVVGRDTELTTMTDLYDKTILGATDKRIVSIHGEQGIGKTTIMMELGNRLYLQNANVFRAFSSRGDGALRAILKQIIESLDYDDADTDFVNFILSYVNETESAADNYNRNDIIKFVYDCIKDKFVVFIVDDLEYADSFTISFIEKLVPVCKKLCVFFAYRTGNESASLSAFLERNLDHIHNIEPKSLSNEASASLVLKVLGINNISGEFIQTLQQTAHGNPLFIEEILKNLHVNGILYARETDGIWDMDYLPEEYSKIPLPGSIAHAIKEQASKLDDASYAIIEVISLFNMRPVTISDIRVFLTDIVQEQLDTLVSARLLYAVVSGQDRAYRIYNTLMKSYIYDKCDAAKMAELHKKAAEMFINASELSSQNLSEAIFQFEKANWQEKLLECLMEFAKRCGDLGDYETSAKNYEYALDISRKLCNRELELNNMIEMGICIAYSYQLLPAIDIFNDVINLAHESGFSEQAARGEIGLINCYLHTMDYENASIHLERAGDYFNTLNILEGFNLYHQQYLYNLLNFYMLINRTDLFFEKYEWVMEHIGPMDMGLKVRSLFQVGDVYLQIGENDKSRKILDEARKIAYEMEDIRVLDFALSILSMCYKRLGDIEMSAAVTSELIETSRDMQYLGTGHMTMAELAQTIEEAYEHLLAALNLFSLCENKLGEISARISIIKNRTLADHLTDAYMHLTECKILGEKSPWPDDVLGMYSANAALFYSYVGDALQMRSHADIALEKSGDNPQFTDQCDDDLIYIKALSAKGKGKRHQLEQGLSKAWEHDRHKYAAYICRELAEFYESDSYRRLDYLVHAHESVQELMQNVPEEFHEMFVSRHGILASVKQIEYKEFENKLSDTAFVQSVQKEHLAALPYNIKNRYDIMGYLTDDAVVNLELLAKYFTAICCATNCKIVVEDEEDDFIIIASNDDCQNLSSEHIHVLMRAKNLDCDVLATRGYNNIGEVSETLLPERTKAVMCIPCYAGDKINGYIYMSSNSIFNQIGEESLNEVKHLVGLVSVNISLHITKVSASLDKLTGGLNRKFLEIALNNHVEKAERTGGIFSIIMSDLDKFKSINDMFGHKVGDLVIKGTGKVIRENLRKDTAFGRYGGEEFIVILDNVGPKDAYAIAEKLRIAVENARLLGSKRAVTSSMGIATFNLHGTTKASLIEKADKALYVCKENGRNRSEVYDPAFEASAKIQKTTLDIISGDAIKDAMRIRTTLDILDYARITPSPSDRQDIFRAKLEELIPEDLPRDSELASCIRDLAWVIDGVK